MMHCFDTENQDNESMFTSIIYSYDKDKRERFSIRDPYILMRHGSSQASIKVVTIEERRYGLWSDTVM